MRHTCLWAGVLLLALPLSAKTIRGTVTVYAADGPETTLGIDTADGKTYGIIGAQVLRHELAGTEGREVRLTGTVQKPGRNPAADRKDGCFFVKSWRPAEE